ncbi:hypothetical protein V2G26_002843 [Clonostachys chloroleuca]
MWLLGVLTCSDAKLRGNLIGRNDEISVCKGATSAVAEKESKIPFQVSLNFEDPARTAHWTTGMERRPLGIPSPVPDVALHTSQSSVDFLRRKPISDA